MDVLKSNSWKQKIIKISKTSHIKKRFTTVPVIQCLKVLLMVFFVYSFFAVDFVTHGQEGSFKIFYIKILVVGFVIIKYIFKWSPRFSFTRKLSQFMAIITRIYLPPMFRKPIYSTFAQHYGIVTKDMVKPYKSYKNFNEFFTRTVKPRLINPDPCVGVSPADAKILSISQISSNDCLLVKGINYSVGHFLSGHKNYTMDTEEINSHYRQHEGSTIWSCILYLAPGDYHRYHSPVEFLAKRRTHIIGRLAPVKESYISKNPGVYEGNERVVLQGDWQGGFMFVTFVGATNVGSMTINFEPKLVTNEYRTSFDVAQSQDYESSQFKNQVNAPYTKKDNGVSIPKGAEIGKFNMGSTVVLIFESKSALKWNVRPGEKVRYGQPLFQVE